MAKNGLDRLNSQLYHLPAMVGRLGLSIAEAQRELNADYLRNVKELMALINHTIGQAPTPAEGAEQQPKDDKLEAVKALLVALAPPRYQFTETTLEFSADLAEHLSVGSQVGVSAGVNVGVAAVAVNASVSLGYARDYRAAARVTTVLHAHGSENLSRELLNRAKELQANTLSLPEQAASVDDEIWQSTSQIYSSLTGVEVESTRQTAIQAINEQKPD